MTEIKIDGKVTAAVSDGLGPHVGQMFARQDGRWVALVELKHRSREEPGVGEDKDKCAHCDGGYHVGHIGRRR